VPIVIYRACEIVTLDSNCPTANAVAVSDGRILHVGEFTKICEYLSDAVFEVDDRFKDDVIVPGFIEAHGHTFGDGALGSLFGLVLMIVQALTAQFLKDVNRSRT